MLIHSIHGANTLDTDFGVFVHNIFESIKNN